MPLVRIGLALSLIFSVVPIVSSFTNSLHANPYANGPLFTKEYITDTVALDAKGSPYTVFDYSPSIYQYEWSYLFKWRHAKDVPYDPGNNPQYSWVVYL